MNNAEIEAAHVVLPCPEPLSATLNFFIELGFKVRTIVPADHPRMAVMQGFGLTIRLDSGSDAPPAHLRLLTTGDVPPPADRTERHRHRVRPGQPAAGDSAAGRGVRAHPRPGQRRASSAKAAPA